MADVENLNQFRKKRRRHEKKSAQRITRQVRPYQVSKETAQKTETDRIFKLDGKKRETPPHF